MSKYTEITQQMRTIEQGRFQILCIEYLKFNVGGIVHSPGTVDGKEKTKTGHPDVYLKQDDGKYVLGECTTKDDQNTSDFYAKLEQDLKACLDFDKLKITKEKIDSIYLCCNSSVEASLIETLESFTKPFAIRLEIIGLHELALHFSSAGKVFAKDFLGISYQTGQVLTKAQFLTQYQKKNLSTPLNNPIFGRESELSTLAEQLNLHDLILVNGPAGVGKSRLAIEAMDVFIASNPDFTPYYVFPKSSEITDDLATFLKPEKSYILLIDDANRQLDNLIKVLEKIIESEIKLKVVITVRDYAKDEVIRQCGKMEIHGFILRKLSNHHIKEIISKEPFSITHWEVTNRIVQISDGNPRLAIMAAEIMRSDPELILLLDVTRIYDAYFDNILSDIEIFKYKHTRQVLGIVSFFYTIDTSEVLEQNLITSFGLKVDEFIECCEQLEELEIIEIYDGSVVRISEQVIATYFFYDSFFRNIVLDFSILLAHCYQYNIYRLKDSVIPSINAFGENNIINKKQSEWVSFWNVIKENRDTAISFMRIFGRYFADLFFTWISSFPNKHSGIDKNTFQYQELAKPKSNDQNDEILNLLEIFYVESDVKFETAVYLSFEYAAGSSDTLVILIDKLKTGLHITKSEIAKELPKITFVYNFLTEKANLDQNYKTVLYLLMDHAILRVSWRTELYHHIDEKYVLKDILKTFRNKLIWHYLNDYQTQKPFILSLLLDYVWKKSELRYPEIDEDFRIIAQIIEKFMHPSDFPECYFVNKYAPMVAQKGSDLQIKSKTLLEKFESPTYDLYSLLSMKYHLTKEATTWDDFYKQKTKEISTNIRIQTLDDFIKLHGKLSIIMDFKKYRSDIDDGVAILMRSILSKDIKLGLECLEYYLRGGNIVFLNGSGVLRPILTHGKQVVDRFYVLINQHEFQNKNEWINSFFLFLPEKLIDDNRINQLVEFYRSHSGPIDIHSCHYTKYETHCPGTKAKILGALHDNRKINENFTYKLAHNFFQESPELLDFNFGLCKDVYFQQEDMPESYDHDGTELMVLLEKENLFFDHYFDWLIDIKNKIYANDNKVLSRIWALDSSDDIVYRSMLKIMKVKPYSRNEHLACIFFYSTREEHHLSAYGVLQKLIKDYPSDRNILNMVIDTARNGFSKFHIPLIQLIISENDDIALFKELQFHNNHFGTSTGEIWSEKKSTELKEIKAAILAMPTHYKYFEHKNYLDERIAAEDRDTAKQKRYMFRGFW